MKRTGLCVVLSVAMLMASAVQAAVVSFTPSGTTTVSQDTNLYWDMLSSDTSISTLGAIGNFYLSGHGDFHFNGDGSMVIVAGTEGGAKLPLGTMIGPGSEWRATDSYVGTTAYDGTMVPPETAYFGVRFQLGGADHFGWVQIEEGVSDQSVLAWAYETTPRQAIAAGATVGGASGIPTLGQWALILLAALMAVLGIVRLSQRKNSI